MTTTTTNDWPAKLKAWRATKSQEQAARRLGVSNSTYIRWEAGKSSPRGLNLVAVERELEAKP